MLMQAAQTCWKRLKLSIGPSEEIMLITSGTEKPQRVKTLQVYLNIKLNDGKLMAISANVVQNHRNNTKETHTIVCQIKMVELG